MCVGLGLEKKNNWGLSPSPMFFNGIVIPIFSLWYLTSNQKVLFDTTHIKKVIAKLYSEKQNNWQTIGQKFSRCQKIRLTPGNLDFLRYALYITKPVSTYLGCFADQALVPGQVSRLCLKQKLTALADSTERTKLNLDVMRLSLNRLPIVR